MDPGSGRTKVGLRQGLVVQLQVRWWAAPLCGRCRCWQCPLTAKGVPPWAPRGTRAEWEPLELVETPLPTVHLILSQNASPGTSFVFFWF